MKKNLLLLLPLIISITAGCKKDSTQSAVVELTKSKDTISLITFSVLKADEEGHFIEVQLENGEVAKSDITIRLMKDQTLVTSYNSIKGTSYEDMPPALLNISSLGYIETTIPKGQTSAWVKCKIAKAAYNYTKSYAVGYSIESVSGSNSVSTNKKNLVVVIRLINNYDGVYASKGFGTHPGFGAYSFNSPCEPVIFQMVTSGDNSVDLKPGHPIGTPQGVSYFSTILPRFTINASTNAISVSDAPGSITVFDPFPTYPARWDPSSKTVYVKVGWYGTRIYTDTFTWCKPRPY